MTDAEPASPSDTQLAWMEQHAGRIYFAGVLVAVNLVIVAIVEQTRGLGFVGLLLFVGLATASLLLLHRAIARMMRGAVHTARREARVSLQMMLAVEQIGAEPAGVRGTVEALAASAQEAGLEIFVWEEHDRALWSPMWGRQVPVTAAEGRHLQEALTARRALRVLDATDAGANPLPDMVGLRGGAMALVVAPMWSAGEFLGVVLRRYRTARDLQRAGDDTLIGSMAALGAVALGKAAVVDREQQRARDNELLLRSVHAASENQQRDRLIDHVQQAVEAARVDRGAIFALDTGRLRMAGAVGIERLATSGSGTLRLRSGLADLAIHAGSTPFTCDTARLDEATSVVLNRLGFDGNIAVQALRDANGVVGLIVLDRPQLGLDDDMSALLTAIGRQASMAIERTRMLRSIRKRSRHLACTPKLARSLTGQREPDAVARIAARELHEGFGYGRVTIALVESGDVDSLRIVASSGASAQSTTRTADGDDLTTDVLRECCTSGRPYVSVAGDGDDIGGMHDGDSPNDCRGRIVVPISGRDRTIVGAIAVYESDPDVLGEDDLHMLETIADQLGGTLEQAELFASLERSYFETVEALSSALEAKDAYTLDHARSITDMSADLGRRLGMREDEVRDLKLGALLHDIGKIGVPTEILSKPGPLTDDEFETMKEHTVIGERIIADVEFLQGVRPLVLHEHERWDGRGYPHQLQGEQIPLGARIIFVCDSWHAMTSDRPYRQALPHDEALRRLREGAGSQFDPAVVEGFCDLMATEAFAAHSHAETTVLIAGG
ncbi:MAG: diguanylate cyclase with sensor [Thermoleophilia bacterium]|nr:diguanylate cyclase with sensor [Thermoleophilia bacterium]